MEKIIELLDNSRPYACVYHLAHALAEYCDTVGVDIGASDLVDRARQEWLRSDEEREYVYSIEGDGGSTVRDGTPDQDHRDALADWVRAGNWDEATLPIWVAASVTMVDPVTGDRIDVCDARVEIEAEEPDCEDGCEHDWRSPHSVLGGLRENPGVVGHGGGVIITEVCRHCATYRRTDTWAQDPETGEQGLTAVTYRDSDVDSQAWAARRRDSRTR